MTVIGWIQIVVFFLVILLLTKPLGAYMFRVFEGEAQPLPRVFGPVERFLLRLCGVNGKKEQTWREYAVALLLFSAFGMLVTYAIQRLQQVLPFNPQGLAAVGPDLSFNTAASFTTNTNWQAYTGESTMSYLTQMAGLAWHNFTSAAAGIGVALALARGLTRHVSAGGQKTLGNFWVDVIRAIVYVLLPISVVVALVLVSQGVIQNLSPYLEVQTLEGVKQVIAMGPVASQEVIKELGTNGGGFFNANSAHPFESPTPSSLRCRFSSLRESRPPIGQRPRATRSSLPPAPHNPSATWRAKRCASVSRRRRCSPRSRQMPRVALSTPCMTASRPWAASCRS